MFLKIFISVLVGNTFSIVVLYFIVKLRLKKSKKQLKKQADEINNGLEEFQNQLKELKGLFSFKN